jgi:gliding motility-associated-like protein
MNKFTCPKALLVALLLCISPSLFAQSKNRHPATGQAPISYKKTGIDFIENKGQWVTDAKFKADVPDGSMFITDKGFVYNYASHEDLERIHEMVHEDGKDHTKEMVRYHAYRVNFLGANTNIKYQETNKRSVYHNYFLGNDPSKWASKVGLYGKVVQENVYNGIDVAVYSKGNSLKYDFVVAPGANPAQVVLSFEGVTPQITPEGNLKIKTSINEVIEQAPYTYQVIEGKEVPVKCNYKLNKDQLSFEFPDGYNNQYALVIDPVLVFATYSGGTTNSFYSYATTYDAVGNLYAGSEAWGTGWPVTLNAYQGLYSDAHDVGINKYNATGTDLIYSTYYGGTGVDLPHAMKVNQQDELVVIGSTNSNNLPTSPGAYDNTMGGASDMFVAHFNSTGTALIGGTYVGGSGIEPTQFTFDATSGITVNNGAATSPVELTFDNSGNIWVIGNTTSADFPTQIGDIYTTLTLNKSICPGESYQFGPATLTTAGTYKDTFTTANCDSIVTINLIVNPYLTSTINKSICAGSSYQFGTLNLTQTGIYIDTFATAGCDSIATLNLTVNPYITNTVNTSICAGSSYPFGSLNLSTSGTYIDTFATAGCDSIVTLNLVVNPYITATINGSICAGGKYPFGPDNLTAAGTYVDTFKTFGGCDSIVTLQLTVGTYFRYAISGAICPGGSYNFGGTALNAAGTYIDTFSTAGCDSIVTLYLAQKPYIRNTVHASICIGDSYPFGPQTLTIGGTYIDTFTTAGCDSIVTLHLVVKNNIINAVNKALCPGESYQFGTQILTTAGIYIQTFPTAGCDSVVTLNLTVKPYITHAANESMCPGVNYMFGTQVLTAPGVYVDTFSTAGCDSIVTLTLTGSYTNALSGGIDGVLFKFDPTCSNLLFSRYIGGTGSDAPFGLLLNHAGNVVISGVTSSTDFPTTASSFKPLAPGGLFDGFATILNPHSGAILSSTYLGTTGVDQAVNIQVDEADNVYVLGRTNGNYPVSAGAWNSSTDADVFIDKLTSNLSTSIMSTRVGNPTTNFQRYFPSAFLVDICENVYVSGFYAVGGLPLTNDAFQTNNVSFWFCVIKPNLTGLLYGTYFGVAGDHSHIGVHRLDPNGIVYHSICNNAQYPFTAPNVWAPDKLSTGQDIVSFKFNFEATGVNSNFQLDPAVNGNDTGCAPYTIQFVNNSTAADNYNWDFGDGTTSNLAAPAHTYTVPGTYIVSLHANNDTACITDDTAYMTITVLETSMPDIVVNDTTLCSYQQSIDIGVHINNPSANNTILWGPGTGILSAPDQPTITVDPSLNNIYYVTVKDTIPGICGFTAVDTVRIKLAPRELDIINNDTVVCEGTIVRITAVGTPDYTYHWTPAIGVSDTTILEPEILINQPNIYVLTGSHPDCPDTSVSIKIQMHYIPHLTLPDNKSVCQWTEVSLPSTVTPYRNDYIYEWTPVTPNLNNPASPNADFIADTTITYYLNVKTPIGCSDNDSIKITVFPGGFGAASSDTGYCPNNEAALWATGGISYAWTPAYGLSDTTVANPVASPLTSTDYTVFIKDVHNCVDTEYVSVQVYPAAMIELPDSINIYPGEKYHIEPGTNALYFKWFPPSGISNINISDPLVSPEVRTRYFVTATTEHGCIILDSLDVLVKETVIDMPNAFTPSSTNNLFKPSKRGIAQLKNFTVFNRWGNKVFSTSNIDEGWDGSYKGEPQPMGVYIYTIEAVSDKGVIFTKQGNVTLIR